LPLIRRAANFDAYSVSPFAPLVGCSGLLGTYCDELSRFDSAERLQDRWQKRAKLLHTIRSGDNQDDTDAGSPKVLLERQVLIDGQEAVEPSGHHQPQKFAVPFR